MQGVTSYKEHSSRVQHELLHAGATIYGLLKAESRYLPHIIHPDEHIHAIIYGQHNSSSAMLVATDKRVIYLDKKPMATIMDEVTYDVVSGIEFDVHTFFATVVLHTAVKNYEIRFVNIHCADTFANYIEEQRIKREEFLEEKEREPLTREQMLEELQKNLAGYYWIPKEEEREEV